MSGQRVDAKVVMLGKEYVGKTSLVERYVHNRFLVGPYQNVSVCLANDGIIGMSHQRSSFSSSIFLGFYTYNFQAGCVCLDCIL